MRVEEGYEKGRNSFLGKVYKTIFGEIFSEVGSRSNGN